MRLKKLIGPLAGAARVFLFLFFLLAASNLMAAAPKNVILMIGDGMGFEQVKAAQCYNGAPLCFESPDVFPYQAEMTTRSANNRVTDSAASATAMATGHKTNNDVVCQAIPPNDEYPERGSDMPTSLEILSGLGKATGLVTTTHITHATPACFGAHTSNRDRYSEIASDLLYNSRPNVMFAGGGEGMCESEAKNAGYTVVTDAAGLQRLTAAAARRGAGARGGVRAGGGLAGGPRGGPRYSGQFGYGNMPFEYDEDYSTLPHLSQMTAAALGLLDDDPEGFFLMVEGGRIDHAGHGDEWTHDLRTMRNITETIEFANAVQVVIDWMGDRTDTLVIVTADHECGGLKVVADKGKGNQPDVTWATGDHTGVNVPVYALGPNAEMVSGVIDNTDVFTICTAGAEAAVEEGAAVSVP